MVEIKSPPHPTMNLKEKQKNMYIFTDSKGTMFVERGSSQELWMSLSWTKTETEKEVEQGEVK